MLRVFLFTLVFQFCFVTPDITASPPQEDLKARLGRRIPSYNMGVSNFPDALIRVSNDYQIPMGIAWVNTPGARAQVPYAWKNATVREIIEAIAGTQRGYQVQVKTGIVDISPRDLIPERQNFLKLRIQQFEVHNEYIELASFKLHMLVSPINYSQISIGGTGDSKVDVIVTNSTTEDALDALVLASNRKIWVVTFSDDSRLTSRDLRRTASLWNDKPQPDQEQPGWDLLRWGDKLPPSTTRAN